MTPFERQRIAFAIVLLNSKPAQLNVHEYFQLLRSQIKKGVPSLEEPAHLAAINMLKQRISSLEKEKVILISKQSLDRQRIKDLEEEINKLKESQNPETKKRKRPVRKETRFKLPLPRELQKTLNSALGDVTSLPDLFHSLQVILSTNTTTEQAISASYILSTSLIAYFDNLITHPNPHYHSLPDPTSATNFLFSLLARFYSSITAMTGEQRAQVGEIIMDAVAGVLTLLRRSCELLSSAPSKDSSSHIRDYRDTFVEAILTLTYVTSKDTPLRQALILCLFLEMKHVLHGEAGTREYLGFVYYLLEQVVLGTGRISIVIQSEVKKILGESLLWKRDDKMRWKDEVIWKLCGMMSGIAGLDLGDLIKC